jgi:uncharacterized protein DUF5994
VPERFSPSHAAKGIPGAASADPACNLNNEPFRSQRLSSPGIRSIRSACDPIRKPTCACAVGLELKEAVLGSRGFVPQSLCASGCLGVTGDPRGRNLRKPVRFTLTPQPGSGLDGAWWPHTVSIARELSDLTDAVREPLGEVIDIGVNWSPLQGVPNLDLLNSRVGPGMPGADSRHLRIMTITGSRARADLLVVPCGTSIALAVMLLRQAADLPVMHAHQHTTAFHTAGSIVRAARAQHAGAPSAAAQV